VSLVHAGLPHAGLPPAAALAVLLVAGLWAGTQNALAGGGSFVTLPALILSGLDARGANITSTLALFPGQVVTGAAGRRMVSGAEGLSFRRLAVLSLVGGVAGAGLLLLTPSSLFAAMLPWLILAATGLFAWGSFGQRPHTADRAHRLGPLGASAAQFAIAVYGGYFGGGIGFLMLAALTLAGLPVRNAGATKNVLAALMNASAAVIFVFSREVAWLNGAALCLGALVGGLLGAWMLKRVNETWLRVGVVVLGIALTIALFLRRAWG
jgi:uncharacterized membrane protein YfcA